MGRIYVLIFSICRVDNLSTKTECRVNRVPQPGDGILIFSGSFYNRNENLMPLTAVKNGFKNAPFEKAAPKLLLKPLSGIFKTSFSSVANFFFFAVLRVLRGSINIPKQKYSPLHSGHWHVENVPEKYAPQAPKATSLHTDKTRDPGASHPLSR